MRAFVLLLPLPLLVACPSEEPEGPNCPEGDYAFAEASDEDNGFARDAEDLGNDWNPNCSPRLQITGTTSACDYDYQAGDGEWGWEGDEDNFLLTVPDDGWLDLELSWEQDASVDMTLYFGIPTGTTISPDEIQYGDNNEIRFQFDDPVSQGDDIIIGVLCRDGQTGPYTIDLFLEPN